MQEQANVINKSDIQKVIKMNGPLGKFIASMVMRLLEFNKVNKAYNKCRAFEGPEFSQKILEELQITYEIPEGELENLPKGPFITISNHCFGGADGLLISSIVGSRNPDFKILTNFILSMIPTLRDTFLPVNPFKNGETNKKSFSGIRMAREHLENGGSLGLFPAGAVATYMKKGDRTAVGKGRIIEDWPWPTNMAKLIKNANIPVVPIYFEGQNSRTFHFLGRIKPIFRTMRLVHELFNKQGQCIPMRIGRPIMPSEFADYDNLADLGNYLRSRLFALESELPANSAAACAVSGNAAPLAEPVAKEKLAAEIAAIEEKRLFTEGKYSCYLADYDQIPNLMQELGRLREETFRAVGEGTDKPSDTDIFDTWYKHMILWDNEAQRIAGAYRFGIGPQMFKTHGGVKSFYTASLIRYQKRAEEFLPKCIELGRSFVTIDYQKESFAFQMLFKGLMYSVVQFPEAEYFLGPVSISNGYPKFWQSLMTYFINENFSENTTEPLALPVTPFEPDYLRVDPKQLLKAKMDSVDKFDRMMMVASNGKYRIPPLVKRYFKNGAKIVCFNVDPDFNYSLDGLIISRFKDHPEEDIQSLLKGCQSEETAQKIKTFFGIAS